MDNQHLEISLKNWVVEENTPNLNSQRWKYSNIIKDLRRAGIQGKELAELKICQILVHSNFLSYIVTGYGNTISLTLWIGKPHIM